MTNAPRPEGPLSQSVERLRSELDRWLDAAWSQGERAMDAIGIRPGKFWSPPLDVIETPDSVQIVMNLPGVDTAGIELTLAGHMLTVSGLLPSPDLGAGGTKHLSERPAGEFRRSIPLPAAVDPEKITAACQHGVLTVTVAKSEQQKSRKIPVSAGNATL